MIQGQPPAPKTMIPIIYPLIAPLDETDLRFHASEKIRMERKDQSNNCVRVP